MREMLDSQNASEALAERVEGDRMAAFGMSETGHDSAVLLKTQRFGRVLTLKVQRCDIATRQKRINTHSERVACMGGFKACTALSR
jgi:hypothetical protein